MSGNLLRYAEPYGAADNPLTQGSPTWADAASYNAGAVGDYIARQRAQSVAMGLLDPNTGLPTAAGVVNAGQQYGNALLMGTTAPGFRAFHGSPHDFNAFDASKIGTGEGAQAYGHGLYFAEHEDVAQSYKMAGPAANSQIDAINTQMSALAKQMDQYSGGQYGKFNDPKGYELKAQYDALMDQRTKLGHMYEVQVNADPAHFLDWDKPLSEQSPAVRDRLQMLLQAHQVPRANNAGGETTGSQLYNHLYDKFGGDAAAVAQELHGEGIPGIRYLDAGSRGQGGTSNTVVFDPSTIEILRKYGIAGLLGGGGAAAATQGGQDQ